ncbi:MAG: carboxypeptidase-like regulatory domain-containing protein, partial [Cyclobacteriaceae bacterium]|nr:carboxypeptidase-like regulatory domain-containing protein [Cyclobacteriaceae bacterium SS2]
AAGLSQELQLKHEVFSPLFDFRYYRNPGLDMTTDSVFRTSEISLKTRYAKDEIFVINDNDRLSMGTVRWPVFEFKYTYGFKDVLESSFEYHKFRLSFAKRQKMGILGISKIKATGGLILGDLPYPLLYNTIGNQTPFYVDFAYNLMDYFEFSSDRFVELRYKHSFEGIILNTIPLLKRLKWRLIGEANVLYGDLSQSSINRVIYPLDMNNDPILPFSQFRNKPYIEVGYGVENIFRFLSVQAFHRLTYLDQNNVNKFAIKFNIDFNL